MGSDKKIFDNEVVYSGIAIIAMVIFAAVVAFIGITLFHALGIYVNWLDDISI